MGQPTMSVRGALLRISGPLDAFLDAHAAPRGVVVPRLGGGEHPRCEDDIVLLRRDPRPLVDGEADAVAEDVLRLHAPRADRVDRRIRRVAEAVVRVAEGDGARQVRAVTIHPRADVDDDGFAGSEGGVVRHVVGDGGVAPHRDDGWEGVALRTVLAEVAVDHPRDCALRRARSHLRHRSGERGVRDGDGAADGGDLCAILDHPHPLRQPPDRVQRHAGERRGQFFVPVPREVRLEAEGRDAEGADARRRVHDAVTERRGHDLNRRVPHVRLRFPRARGGAEERRVPVCRDKRPARRLVHRVVLLAEAGEVAPVVGVGDEQRVDLLLADHRGESLEAVRGVGSGHFSSPPPPSLGEKGSDTECVTSV